MAKTKNAAETLVREAAAGEPTTVVTDAPASAPVADTSAPAPVAAAPQAAPAAVEPPTLGIQDIQNVLKIIDFAADQGVFKGWGTIQQVFSVREKVAAFVAFAQANADETAAAPQA